MLKQIKREPGGKKTPRSYKRKGLTTLPILGPQKRLLFQFSLQENGCKNWMPQFWCHPLNLTPTITCFFCRAELFQGLLQVLDSYLNFRPVIISEKGNLFKIENAKLFIYLF